MDLSWWKLGKKNKNLVAIIDIGSSRVSAALWDNTKKAADGSHNFLFQKSHELFFPSGISFERFLGQISRHLEELVQEMVKFDRPSRVVCFLSSPLFISQTKIINLKNEEPVKITKQLVQNLINIEAQKFLEKPNLLLSETDENKNELLENLIMQIKLNGYETKDPYGQNAERLEIAQHLSAASSLVLNKIRSVLSPLAISKDISFHSFSFAAFTIFRELAFDQESFVLIDVSGELTDIISLYQGVLMETVSFPVGKNTLLRKIAENSNSSYQEALSALKIYQSKTASPKLSSRIDFSLNQIKANWLSSFKKALEIIIESSFLPEVVYVIGDEASDKFFVDFIKKENLLPYTLSTKNLAVEFIEKDLLKKWQGEKKTGTINTFLLVETLFCDKIYLKEKIA